MISGIDVLGFLVSFAFLFVAITVHEFSHGLAAYLFGDRTAQYAGRLTLNPLAHIDPVGTVLLPLVLFISTGGRFVFGAAKPVPISFANLNNPRRDIIWVGLAGPSANFLLAFLVSLLWKVVPHTQLGAFIFSNLITINVVLGVFNLIPIPPLDGSRLVMGILPGNLSAAYASVERYGFFIIMGLMWLGVLDLFLWPAVSAILKLLL